MSWEGHRVDAAIVENGIPEESIRLRILANSDSPQDQAVKRFVRDAIVAEMASWVAGPQSIEQARETLRSNLPAIERVVAQELRSRGFQYGFEVELGMVPFPTKMYGSEVYPAGDYEALRVSLGRAEGQNWWCVLFPPLCFVDGVTGEATAAAQSAAAQAEQDPAASVKPVQASETPEKPEVKFFLWELIRSLLDFFRQLFS
ncbi:stage II sporulation protein R [Paenibacillus abyssi]|uniref:Stage II sporulation protein R n=2 Tax=Paenibacillus abyssi TaxID=1340531 RepID=A0A917FLB1_9BACL|nr:stage II sporulation protein R [Paenibacillus abyssi]